MTNTIKNVDSTTKKAKPIIQLVNIIEPTTLYKSEKDILINLVKANNTAKDLQVEYQRIAVSLLQHLNIHRDIRIIANFFNKAIALTKEQQESIDKAMKIAKVDRHELLYFPSSMFLEAMVIFMSTYGQVTFKKELIEGKQKVIPMFDKDKDFNLTGALQNAWYKKAHQSLEKIHSFNLLEAIDKLLTQAKKHQAKLKDGDFVPSELVDGLESFFKDAQFKVKKATVTKEETVIAA